MSRKRISVVIALIFQLKKIEENSEEDAKNCEGTICGALFLEHIENGGLCSHESRICLEKKKTNS